MNRLLRLAYFVFALLFVLMVSLQIVLAGLSLFWRDSVWQAHVGAGHMAPVFPFVMLILALVGHLPLRLRTWSAVLLGAVLVQTELFVLIREVSGLAAAFHPLLAAGLFWGGIVVAQRAWVLVRQGDTAAAGSALSVEPAAETQPAAPACSLVPGSAC